MDEVVSEGLRENKRMNERLSKWKNEEIKGWRNEGLKEPMKEWKTPPWANSHLFSEMLLLDVNFSPSHYISVVYIFSVSTCIMREVVFTVCLMYNIFSTISGTSGHPVFFWDQCALETQNGNRSPECSAVNLFLLLHSSCGGSRYTFARHLKTDENIDHGSCNNDSFTRCGCLSGKTV